MTSYDAPTIQARIARHQQRREDPWLLLAAAYARAAEAVPVPTGCAWEDWVPGEYGKESLRCGRPVAGHDPGASASPITRYFRDRGDRQHLPLCERHEAVLAAQIQRWAEVGYRGAPSNPLVYYIRRSDGLIKIGASVRPRRRLLALMTAAGPLELLATETGGYEVEARRHRQFAEARSHGEWFEPIPDLLAHVAELQESMSHVP